MARQSGFKLFAVFLALVMGGLFLQPATAAWADTLYVDQTNTTGPWDGTEAYPYKKIQDAINAANSGDTVFVNAGTYDVAEGEPGYPQGITISKSLNLQGESPGNTFIEGPNDAIYSSGAMVSLHISGIAVRGIGRYGIYCNDIGSLIVENVVICGCGSEGMFVNDTPTTVLNSVIISNGSHGIHVRVCTPTTVANSILAFNYNYGAYGYSTTETAQNNCCYDNRLGCFSDWSSQIDTINSNPEFIDYDTCNVQLDLGISPCKDAGRIGDLDPDGTRADIGAWGGPGAARFWPYPEGGPTITSIEVEPSSVPAGGTITIRATGEIR